MGRRRGTPLTIELPGRTVEQVVALPTTRAVQVAPDGSVRAGEPAVRGVARFHGTLRPAADGSVVEGVVRESLREGWRVDVFLGVTAVLAVTAVTCFLTGQWAGLAVCGTGALVLGRMARAFHVSRRQEAARAVARLARTIRKALGAPPADARHPLFPACHHPSRSPRRWPPLLAPRLVAGLEVLARGHARGGVTRCPTGLWAQLHRPVPDVSANPAAPGRGCGQGRRVVQW